MGTRLQFNSEQPGGRRAQCRRRASWATRSRPQRNNSHCCGQYAEPVKIRDLAIITVLLHTGIRVSELCNLRVSDISISDNSNMLTVREGKGAKRRNIPLNPTVSRVLKDYIKTIGSQKGHSSRYGWE